MTSEPSAHASNDQKTGTAVTTATNTADDELLPIGEIKKLAGIGKTMIYRLEREGSFPKRYKPGGYASRWSRREVMDWRERQREARA